MSPSLCFILEKRMCRFLAVLLAFAVLREGKELPKGEF